MCLKIVVNIIFALMMLQFYCTVGYVMLYFVQVASLLIICDCAICSKLNVFQYNLRSVRAQY